MSVDNVVSEKILEESEKVEYLKKLIDIQLEQHKDLLGTISEIRGVCNFIITAIFTYSAYIYISNKFQ